MIHRRSTGPIHPTMARYYVFRGSAVPLVYLSSIPIAFVNPGAAKVSWLLAFVLQFVGRRVAERRAGVDVAR